MVENPGNPFDDGHESRDRAQQSRLSRPVGPTQQNRFPTVNAQTDPSERGEGARQSDGRLERNDRTHDAQRLAPPGPGSFRGSWRLNQTPHVERPPEPKPVYAPTGMQKIVDLTKKPAQRGVEIPRRPIGQSALLIAGKALIWAGILVLGFAGYQLWGTDIAEASSQRTLKSEFQQFLQANPLPAAPTTTVPTSTVPVDPAVGTTVPTTIAAPPANAPVVLPGEAVAIIHIPKIDVEKIVVSGVGVPDLKKGPGHYISTPLPGEPGNAAIAGHRTTYGAPFYNLDSLGIGDEIRVTTRAGEFVYIVNDAFIVRPSDTTVLAATDDNRLTLTTCNPRFSDRQRLIVTALLQGSPVAPGTVIETPPAVAETDLASGEGENGDIVTTSVAGADPSVTTPTTLPSDSPSSTVPDVDAQLKAQQNEIEENSLAFSGDPGARLPTLAWGFVAIGVWVGFWALGRRWRKIPAFLLGVLPFSVVMFEFYQQFARVLPGHV